MSVEAAKEEEDRHQEYKQQKRLEFRDQLAANGPERVGECAIPITINRWDNSPRKRHGNCA